VALWTKPLQIINELVRFIDFIGKESWLGFCLKHFEEKKKQKARTTNVIQMTIREGSSHLYQ